MAETLARAVELSGAFDAIQLGSPPGAASPVSPLALCSLLLHQGIDPIPVLDCRDRNRIALQSDLLGLRAMGVTSLVLEQGRAGETDPAGVPVFDVSGAELIAMAGAMNEEDWDDGEHEFIIGTRSEAEAPEPGWNGSELETNAASGARFLQVQPCSHTELLRRYVERLVETRLTWSYSVIVSLSCPEEGGAHAWAERIREAASIPGLSGVNLPVPGDPETALAAVADSGLFDHNGR